MIKLKLQYISSVIFRVLPNQRYNLHWFSHLFSDSKIKKYFNNVRSLNEYPGLYDRFKNSKFDMSLVDQVRTELQNVRTTFFKQITGFSASCLDRTKFRGLCGINQSHLDYVASKFMLEVFKTDSPSFIRPTIDEVLAQLNLKASMGLPDPFIKKRDSIDLIKEHLTKFFNSELSPNDVFTFPAAIFLRLQIRESGLKTRVVHAVQGFQQCLESFYYLFVSSALPHNSSIAMGVTQREISQITSEYVQYNSYSVDYKVWDNTRQPVLSVISFEILRQILPLTDYEEKILITLRNIYLTLPSFHPLIELKRRWVGTVSGSGFTSLDNSICNYIITHILMYEYCLANNIDIHSQAFTYGFHVCGDDMILRSNVPIDMDKFSKIALRMFGAVVKLESKPAVPGVDNLTFLGSNWVNGSPYRSERVMVASVIFGSGNFPQMSEDELLQSRFFEIFGNSADCLDYFKKLNIKLPKRVFFFNELSNPFMSGSLTHKSDRMLELENNSSISKTDNRGFWYGTRLNSQIKLNLLWRDR